MVIHGGDETHRGLDPGQVDRRVGQRNFPGILEQILEVKFVQIPMMHIGRHTGGVRIPVQQIKRFWIVAQQIIVDEERPYQVIGAQKVEGSGH